MAEAMLVGIGLVYVLLVPLVTFFTLPLAVIGCFVSLAVIGHATNIITGLAVSLQAEVLPVTVIATGVWIAYSVGGGLFGVAVVAAALLSMAGIVVAVDSYDPIRDNLGGIAEMSELPYEVRTFALPHSSGSTRLRPGLVEQHRHRVPPRVGRDTGGRHAGGHRGGRRLRGGSTVAQCQTLGFRRDRDAC
jgi:hypothetical protein